MYSLYSRHVYSTTAKQCRNKCGTAAVNSGKSILTLKVSPDEGDRCGDLFDFPDLYARCREFRDLPHLKMPCFATAAPPSAGQLSQHDVIVHIVVPAKTRASPAKLSRENNCGFHAFFISSVVKCHVHVGDAITFSMPHDIETAVEHCDPATGVDTDLAVVHIQVSD